MPRNVQLLSNFCMYFSNTVNPFIYAGMNPIFRREFRKILCCAQRRNAVGVSARVAQKRFKRAGRDPLFQSCLLQNGVKLLRKKGSLCLIITSKQFYTPDRETKGKRTESTNSLIKLIPIDTREAFGSPHAKKLNNFKTVLAMTTKISDFSEQVI